MKKQTIGVCPICQNKLYVKTLRCDKCETEINGKFELSPFDTLTKEQMDFALVFIKCQGNIKAIEKNMNISYPTVKKNIDELCNALGFKTNDEVLTRDDIKQKLKNGEIDLEEAEKLLGGKL